MMAQWGVSVFLGSAEVKERLPGYLADVVRLGGRQVFTSLHIPEVSLRDAIAQLSWLTSLCAEHTLEVVADIAPKALSEMGASPENLDPLQRMGLAGIRLDYGFQPVEIARFTLAPQKLRVVLNTSTIDPAFLEAVMAAGASPALLESCHNYYPRPETGLSMESFLRSSQVFHRHGLKVAAFVPALGAPRGPLFEGLPTIERHRQLEAGRAAAELLATGECDTVLFGDPWASPVAMARVAEVVAIDGVVLRIRLSPGLSDLERAIVISPLQENRPDAPEFVLRSTASRAYAAKGPAIESFHAVERATGSVTIDNSGYGRYSGELQITLADLPADPRVNVVATVIDEDLPMLRWIGPGRSFKLVPV
jgi:hypothetical protein